jgi:hypothetical protein
MLVNQEEVIGFCRQNSSSFYPAVANNLPYYSDFVNKFIQGRAERDLPKAQLEGEIDVSNLEDLVEMGGLLRIKEGMMAEIQYSHPNESLVEVKDDKIISYGGSPFFPINHFEQGGDIIDYHSHPDGNESLSDGDVEHMMKTFTPVKMLRDMYCPVGDLFFVLYLPHKKDSIWYTPRRIE